MCAKTYIRFQNNILRALLRLIVEIIEPHHGYILDPAAGSGGMFVQSACGG